MGQCHDFDFPPHVHMAKHEEKGFEVNEMEDSPDRHNENEEGGKLSGRGKCSE